MTSNRIIGYLICFCILLSGIPSPAQDVGKIYYLDGQNGNDTYDGTTISHPWKSLERLNKVTFQPGDQILFKAGTEFNGQFEPKGSGSAENPIVVDRYGEGEDPVIHGKGETQQTIFLKNVEYWEINHLEITNQGEQPKAGRNGITILAWNYGEMNHIHLKNLTIRDVNGSTVKSEGGGNGIHWNCGGDSIPSRLVDLLIEDCHIYRCHRNGITGNGNIDRNKWYPSLGVVIRGNLIEEVPGDGIVPIACDGALVEKNIFRRGTDLLEMEDAAAGIWPWSSDNTVIQYNEVSGHKAKWDAQGYDSDYNCFNTVIQYNFSHDNYGGMLLVCNDGNSLGRHYNWGTENTIVRGNVSINDGLRPYPTRPGWFAPIIHIAGPVKNTLIEENVMVILPKEKEEMDRTALIMDQWGEPWSDSTQFVNNIFHVMGDDLPYRIELGESENVVFEGNIFHGKFNGLPVDENERESIPDLIDDFPFPEGFPEDLKVRVIERLAEIR